MATPSDRFIASCASWDEFYRRTRALSNDDKGRVLERFVQLYLQTEPEYRLKLSDVWLAREVPPDVRKATRLLPGMKASIWLRARAAMNFGRSRRNAFTRMAPSAAARSARSRRRPGTHAAISAWR